MSVHAANAAHPLSFGQEYLAAARLTFLERFKQNGTAPRSNPATDQMLADYGETCAMSFFEGAYPLLADTDRGAELAEGQRPTAGELHIARNFTGLAGLLSKDSWLLEHRGRMPRFDRLEDGQRDDVLAELFGESLGVLGVIHERKIWGARVPVRFALLHSVAELETMESSRWT